MRSCRGPRTGHRYRRVPQEPERPGRLHFFSKLAGAAKPESSRPLAGVGPTGRDENRRKGWYRQAKDNEARRKGRPGVGALHSTVEAGERDPRGPWGGKGVPARGIGVGNPREHSVVPYSVHETAPDSAADGRQASGLNCRPTNPRADEPDALTAQVRICGSPG